MSVQNYETDVLQEHVDSTPILINRLDQWRQAVNLVHNYASGYLQIHHSVAKHLESTQKSISDAPTFIGGAQSGDGTAATSHLSSVFQSLQQNVGLLQQRSASTQSGLKSSVLTPLESLNNEIEKHYKSLRNNGGKGIKEVERSRVETQRAVEHLGQVTSSYGSRNLSVHEDPYLLHRKVEAAVLEQVGRENTQAEAALSVQRSFASLENHTVATLRQALDALAKLNESFDKGETEINQAVTKLFDGIDAQREWSTFVQANREHLVPEKNYQRDPRLVTFTNKNSAPTKPIVQGTLNRKGTVLKQYNQSFYVLSSAGFLYQFKHNDEANSLNNSPDLALFLPECQISRSSSNLVFKIAGKDALKTLTTRHKFVFRASSPQELDTWFQAIARVSGNALTSNDDDSGSEESVPTSAQTSTSTQVPTQTSTSAQAPTQTSAQIPTQTSAQIPAQTSTQIPTQSSAQIPAQTSTATSASAHPPTSQLEQTKLSNAAPTAQPTQEAKHAASTTAHTAQSSVPAQPGAHAASAASSTENPFKGF